MTNCKNAKPARMCVVCRESTSPAALLRFVVGPDNKIWFDISGKANGRGAYVHAEHLNDAIKRKALTRALKVEAATDDLINQTKSPIFQAVMQNLGLLKKGNCLVLGGDKVIESLKYGKICAILLATDAAKNTVNMFSHADETVLSIGTKADFEQALGIPNCTVIGISHGAQNVINALNNYAQIKN